ncbi:MAG: hypothetical protein IJT02_06280 [Synergistaceae bacterium]|nr:hypothetical protein [Synergistaceae bacterium]
MRRSRRCWRTITLGISTDGGGGLDLTTNVTLITSYFSRYGFTPNNTLQTVRGFTIYPKDYFCPKSYLTLKIELTGNTHTIHHFSGSWHTPAQKRWIRFKWRVRQLLGERITAWLKSLLHRP